MTFAFDEFSGPLYHFFDAFHGSIEFSDVLAGTDSKNRSGLWWWLLMAERNVHMRMLVF